MKYSDRLGEISKTQFQKALDQFNLGDFIDATPIDRGLFGQNVFIKSTKGEFVLRGCPHYNWQFPAEVYFSKLLHQNNIPVAAPYMYSKSKDIFGWEFILMPRLYGKSISPTMTDKDLSKSDEIGIAKALGSVLKEMQKVTMDHCGFYDLDSDDIKPLSMSYSERIYLNIQNRLLQATEANALLTTKDDMKWIESILEQKQEAMEMSFVPTYVMQDFKLENMVVDKVSGEWKVTGIFDLMESYIGNIESDLSRTYCMYLDAGKRELGDVFVNAFLDDRIIEGFNERFPIFILHDRLIIWSWRIKNNNLDEGMKKGFRWWIERYL